MPNCYRKSVSALKVQQRPVSRFRAEIFIFLLYAAKKVSEMERKNVMQATSTLPFRLPRMGIID